MTAPAKPSKSLVAAFRRALRARGDTMVALAPRWGVTRQHLYEFLAGNRVSAPLFKKVSQYVEAT